MMWIAFAAMWISTAIPVSIGICITGKWQLLWFMIIPTLMRWQSDNDKSKNKESEKSMQ